MWRYNIEYAYHVVWYTLIDDMINLGIYRKGAPSGCITRVTTRVLAPITKEVNHNVG